MKKALCCLLGILVVFMIGVGITSATAKNTGQENRKVLAGQPDCPAIHDCGSCHSFSKSEAGALLKEFGEVREVKPAPVKGLYEVTIRKGNRQAVIYVDYGKKLLMPTPIFDIASARPVSPPPVELPVIIPKADLDKIPRANSIVMGKADGAMKLFVFTDPDCPFCKKLHQELKKLVTLEPELTVYIKLFPLKMHPKSYDKARVILGSNSLELLDKAFSGESFPKPGEKDGTEPVDETIKLGESLGINGTPAMILPNGRLLIGAMDAANIRTQLKK